MHWERKKKVIRHITDDLEISPDSFNKRLKTFHKHDKLTFCKLLPSLDSP